MLTGFLIYDWIEKPHKQEVIKEVLSLLEKKILEPDSGEAHLTSPLFFIRFLFTDFFFPVNFFHTVLYISHTNHMIIHVSQKFVHFCVSTVNIGLCHVQNCTASRLVFVVYLELFVVTFRCSIRLASCLCAHTTTQQEA